MSEARRKRDKRRAAGHAGKTQDVHVSGGVNVNADRVDVAGDIVGRDKIIQNIRQFIMRPWAWVIGIVILSVAVLLVAGISNIGSLRALLPTPFAFAPANQGQSLIIVADFDDRSGGKYQGIDPAQYIYEQLVAQARKDGLDVRIERLRQMVDDSTVRSTGEVYSATLVLWGWYDALTITPRMERIKTRSEFRSTEEGQHLSLADPAKIEFSIITDLPSQATYLTLFTLGVDESTKGNNDEALAYFDSALAAIPEDVEISTNPSGAYFSRGIIYYEKGDYDRAIPDYDQAIRLRPDHANAYNNRGLAYADKGDYDRAIADYDQAIKLRPDDAVFYYNRGLAYYLRSDYDRAIADYDQAIRLRPDDADTYNNRGLAYGDKGNYDRAIADYDQAIRLRPDNARAYRNRGLAYANKGDYDRAVADYNRAIQLQSDYAVAYYNRGLAYHDKGNYDLAIANYDRAIELQPDYANAYYTRGNAYRHKGEYDRAITEFSKAIQLRPDYAAAYNNRCYALYELGRYEEALPDCERAIQLDPNNADILDSRALVYKALGRTQEAIADFARILELTDDSELVDRARKALAELQNP